MRRIVAATGLVVSASLIAAAWMIWVIAQGTNQVIEPGWSAFRYAAPLLPALILAMAAIVSVATTPIPIRNAAFAVAVGVVAGLEVVLFGVFWFSLVAVPFPA